MSKHFSRTLLTLVTLMAVQFSVPAMASPWTITRAELQNKYDFVDPNHMIPMRAKNFALAYYEKNKSKIPNTNYLSVIDYTQKSNKKRFFIIDMRTGEVEAQLVAHGTGSDSNNDGFATVFSNQSGSNATSLGYALTAETYSGKHGRSLRLDGMSRTNSQIRNRAVVVHGAAYVRSGTSQIGRSWGCQALDEKVKDAVISKLRAGSVIYSYHDSFSDGQ